MRELRGAIEKGALGDTAPRLLADRKRL